MKEKNIPMVHHDEDYDDYKTPNTSRTDEISVMEHDTTGATSTLLLRLKVTRDIMTALYRHLNMTGDPLIVDIDRFVIKKNPKTGNTDLLL